MASGLTTGVEKAAAGGAVDWWTTVGGLAGVLGVLGFVLAVINWRRVQPDLFMDHPWMKNRATDGQWIPEEATIIVINAGAGGVTLAELDVSPRATGGRLAAPVGSAAWPRQWLTGPSLPCRLDGTDTKVWAVDISLLHSHVANSGGDWIVTAVWYSRKRLWRWQYVPRTAEKRLPRLKRRSEATRRLRRVQVTFSSSPFEKAS